MKFTRFIMLIKASVLSNKLLSIIYCAFVSISIVLILVAVSIAIPLNNNINDKVRNHVSNREVVVSFAENLDNDYISDSIDTIKNTDHIESVYRIAVQPDVTEQSGILNDMYKLGYMHDGNTPVITSGRVFEKNETGVAVVPESIRDFSPTENRFRNISGKSLINKTLVLADEYNNIHKVKVVGAYSSTDPLYSQKQILIPRGDLIKLVDKILKNPESVGFSNEKNFIALVDSPRNVEAVISELEAVAKVYRQQSLIDSAVYTIALYILIAVILFFTALVVFSFFILLKNNINSRNKELALYRSLGYKSKQLFCIIFFEHFILGIVSGIAGVIIAFVCNQLLINPFVYSITGNTIMEISVAISPVQISFIFLLFFTVLFIVCKNAVKLYEKTDLTVLIRS